MRKLSLLLLLTMIFELSFGQKQNLGFNLQIGQTYFHQMQSSSVIKQDVNGQKVNIEVGVSGTTSFKVLGFNDSIYDMNVSHEKLGMTMKLSNRTISFNSENKDENDIFSKVLGQLIGKQFLMKITTAGKIIEVKNLDLIFDNLFDKLPTISAAQKEQIKAQLSQAYGEKAFKGSFEMVTSIYPNSPVEKGNTWTIKTKLESGMAANLITTFEFKGKTENYNLILGKGKFETLDKDAYVQINGMPTRYNLAGNMTSSIKIDNKSGWIIQATITQKMDGTADIKDNPNLPGGLTIPMSFENSMTFSSK